SSRRRHTRFSRDWSSDVCSSDLQDRHGRSVRALAVAALMRMGYPWALCVDERDLELLRDAQRSAEAPVLRWMNAILALGPFLVRSEERRVGKACRAGWSSDVCER